MTVKEKKQRKKQECLQMGSAWYDRRYAAKKGESYVPYFSLYDTILSRIGPDESILDLGCGVGMFAERAVAQGKMYLFGVDYSIEAVTQASERVLDAAFLCTDLGSYDIPKGVGVVVLVEVLEHLQDDLGMLSRLPEGMRVIFSVPDFDCVSHVRYFPSQEEAVRRYQPVISILSVSPVPLSPTATVWLLDGVRRSPVG